MDKKSRDAALKKLKRSYKYNQTLELEWCHVGEIYSFRMKSLSEKPKEGKPPIYRQFVIDCITGECLCNCPDFTARIIPYSKEIGKNPHYKIEETTCKHLKLAINFLKKEGCLV